MGNALSAGCDGRESRAGQLISIVGQISNIRVRLNDLKQSLGITQPEVKSAVAAPEEINPGTLVETMNRLQGMVSKETDQIHKSLDELNENLI